MITLKIAGPRADKPNEAGELRRQGVLVFRYLLLITCAVCLTAGPASARKAEERWGDLPYPEDSQVVGTLEPYSSPVLDSTNEWHVIAARMADRVKAALAWRGDIIAKPIFVQPTSARPFAQGMTQMLNSELVSRGLQVTLNRTSDTLLLEFSAFVVPPPDKEVSSSYRELLVVMSLWYGNRQVLHTTSSYRVREDELANCVHPGETGFVPAHFEERNVRLVGK